MLIINAELFETLIAKPYFEAKMVLNDRGAIFLPVTSEHRDHKAEGISYEDDYKGSAMAAMIKPGRLEIRYHAGFMPERVAEVVGLLLGTPELQHMRGWSVTYRGNPIEPCC